MDVIKYFPSAIVCYWENPEAGRFLLLVWQLFVYRQTDLNVAHEPPFYPLQVTRSNTTC